MKRTPEIDEQHRKLIAAAEAVAVDAAAAEKMVAILDLPAVRDTGPGKWLRAAMAGKFGLNVRFPRALWRSKEAVVALRVGCLLDRSIEELRAGPSRQALIALARQWSLCVEAGAIARLEAEQAGLGGQSQ